MKLVDEFKAFAMKGNVADMAVGIIIGAASGTTRTFKGRDTSYRNPRPAEEIAE